ncbi:MAG: PilN domain-containing protein [Aestuariivirga sp.]|uniref:PilN domain-containing protein n=1 Tax=Aestuariivirga sp. TaxID=2650926 RepID=UPI0038CFEB3A
MTRDATRIISAAALWRSLRDPVLALAEELALRRGGADKPPVVFKVRSGGIDLERADASGREPAMSASGRPAEAMSAIIQRLGGKPGGDAGIEISADQAVTRQLMLPAESETVLRAITRNKVEGLAPWPLAQCLWGMRVRPAIGESRQVTIDVAIVSRALFEDLAGKLRQAGASVRTLGVELADGGRLAIDFGGEDQRRKARMKAARIAKAAAVVGLAALSYGGYEVYRSYALLSRLSAETAEAAAALRAPAGGGAAETPLVAAANSLREQRLQRPPVVALLNDVSALLPANVYLEALVLNGGKLELKGQGSGIPALIAVLESSPLLKDVNFAAATERDQDSNANAFTLNARFEQDAAAGAAP